MSSKDLAMRLTAAAALFLTANLPRTLDRMRQGLDRLTVEVLAAGTLLPLAAVIGARPLPRRRTA
jgi:hypothetical protein